MRRVAAIIALAMLGAGCGANTDADAGGDESPAVSKESLQADIADRLAESGESARSVTCRNDLVGEIGRTARCDVVISDTNGFQPIVTVTKVDGSAVDYALTPALSQAQLEDAVARLVAENTGAPADSVACESGLVGEVDGIAHCDVDAGGERHRRGVQVTDVTGLTMTYALTSG